MKPHPAWWLIWPPLAFAVVCATIWSACVPQCTRIHQAASELAPVVDPLLRAIGFCQGHPALADDAAAALELARAGDRMGAALRVAMMVEELRAAGVEIPRAVDTDLVRTMAGVEALQRGLRALTCGNVNGCPPDAGGSH